MVVPNGIHAIAVLEEGAAPGYGAWIAVILVSISSLAGAWLARRNSTRVVVWLAIASATMLVIAMTDLLPDAWREAVETGVPLWVIGIAAAIGFLVITYFTRKGCGCEADSGKGATRRHAPGRHRRLKEAVDTALFGGMGTAAALTLHRAIEGATLALTASVVVVLALMVHSASEGLALAALLDMAKQRLAPWLVVACAAPAAGVLAATIHPLPGKVVPVLLGMISGVLTRTAVVGLKLAASKQSNGRLSRRHVTIATLSAVTVGALIVVAHAGQSGQTAQKRTQRADGFSQGSSRPRRPTRASPLDLEKQTRPMISPQPLSHTQHESPPVKTAPAPQSETETLTALRSGRTNLAAVLQRDDDIANSLRVAQVLRALPRYRPDQITTVMATVGISEEHRLGDLSEGQRRQVLTAIGTVRPASTSSFSPQTPTHVDNRTPESPHRARTEDQ
jgi:zinc transporter ZupT